MTKPAPITGRYSDIKKKIFNHNKELDKQKITTEFEKTTPSDFYSINKSDLEEFMPKTQRTSAYWQPTDSVYDTMLLQKMLRTINSITRYVVGKPIGVQFSEVAHNNTAPFDGSKITVSIGSLYDHRIPFHTRLDIVVGLSLHEAFHIKYTTPAIEALLLKNGLTKDQIARFGGGKVKKIADFTKAGKLFKHDFQQTLANAVEDKRIEFLGLEKYPGYVYYFDALRKYAYWCLENQFLNPKEALDWSSDDKIYDALTMYIGLKNLMPEILPVFNKIGPKSSKFKDLTEKADKILSEKVETFQDTLNVSEKLLALYPKEQQDKQAQKNAPGKGKGRYDEDEEGKEGMGSPVTGSEIMKYTPANGKTVKVDEKSQGMIQDTLDDEQEDAKTEEHKVDDSDRMSRTDDYEKIHIVPAPEGMFDQNLYKEASEIAAQISKNLSFLDSRFNRTNQMFEMRNGELDEDAIYGLKYNQDIFWEEEESPGYDLDFGILVDESGSMGGRKIREAQTAALALALALKDNQFINLYVYGHTANTGGHPLTMFKYFNHQEKGCQNINTMFSIRSRANNADGYAIANMGQILAKGKSKQKVLVVASDGYPSASGYGGNPGIKHTGEMVRKLEAQGMFVVQIALEDINSAAMFTNFIPYDKKSLGQNLKKVLLKKLVEISNLV
jgi:hypothetical protein